MKATLEKYLTPLTLLEWGALLLYFFLSGRLAAYIYPPLRPLVLVAAVLLLLTAAAVGWPRARAHDHEHKPDCGCGHDHGHDHAQDHAHEDGHHHDHDHVHEPAGHEPSHAHEHAAEKHGDDDHVHHHHGAGSLPGLAARALILIVPLLAAALISHDRYGLSFLQAKGAVDSLQAIPALAARAAAYRPPVPRPDAALPHPENEEPLPGETAAAPSAAKPAAEGDAFAASFSAPAGAPLPADVTDLIFASNRDFMRKVFEDKPVAVLGQIADNTIPGDVKGDLRLVRFVMVCCAADAQPVQVPVYCAAAAPKLPALAWVKAVGTVHYKADGQIWKPEMDAATVTPATAPDDPYLY